MKTSEQQARDLELAAKAHGGLARIGAHPVMGHFFSDGKVIGVPWNPLVDDGDAFRLASAYGLTVEFGNNMVEYPVEGIGEGTDPLWATRHAIVRAAAEVGKGKLTNNEFVLMFPDRFPAETVERARAAAIGERQA